MISLEQSSLLKFYLLDFSNKYLIAHNFVIAFLVLCLSKVEVTLFCNKLLHILET